VNCPKCGFVQPDSPECLGCGIVIAKYHPEAAEQTPDRPDRVPLAIPTTLPERDTLSEPIGAVARGVRVLAALLCAANAGIMWLNGTALRTFTMYAVLVFFAVACIYALLTVMQRISVRQFSIEVVLVVAVSLTAKLVYPQIFDLEHQEAHKAAPQLVTKYARFVHEARGFTAASRALLAGAAAPGQTWQDLAKGLDWQGVRSEYEALRVADREAVYGAYTAARALGELVAEPARAEELPKLADDARAQLTKHVEKLEAELTALHKSQLETAHDDTEYTER
jgi:hypothetical protein